MLKQHEHASTPAMNASAITTTRDVRSFPAALSIALLALFPGFESYAAAPQEAAASQRTGPIDAVRSALLNAGFQYFDSARYFHGAEPISSANPMLTADHPDLVRDVMRENGLPEGSVYILAPENLAPESGKRGSQMERVAPFKGGVPRGWQGKYSTLFLSPESLSSADSPEGLAQLFAAMVDGLHENGLVCLVLGPSEMPQDWAAELARQGFTKRPDPSPGPDAPAMAIYKRPAGLLPAPLLEAAAAQPIAGQALSDEAAATRDLSAAAAPGPPEASLRAPSATTGVYPFGMPSGLSELPGLRILWVISTRLPEGKRSEILRLLASNKPWSQTNISTIIGDPPEYIVEAERKRVKRPAVPLPANFKLRLERESDAWKELCAIVAASRRFLTKGDIEAIQEAARAQRINNGTTLQLDPHLRELEAITYAPPASDPTVLAVKYKAIEIAVAATDRFPQDIRSAIMGFLEQRRGREFYLETIQEKIRSLPRITRGHMKAHQVAIGDALRKRLENNDIPTWERLRDLVLAVRKYLPPGNVETILTALRQQLEAEKAAQQATASDETTQRIGLVTKTIEAVAPPDWDALASQYPSILVLRTVMARLPDDVRSAMAEFFKDPAEARLQEIQKMIEHIPDEVAHRRLHRAKADLPDVNLPDEAMERLQQGDIALWRMLHELILAATAKKILPDIDFDVIRGALQNMLRPMTELLDALPRRARKAVPPAPAASKHPEAPGPVNIEVIGASEPLRTPQPPRIEAPPAVAPDGGNGAPVEAPRAEAPPPATQDMETPLELDQRPAWMRLGLDRPVQTTVAGNPDFDRLFGDARKGSK